MKYKNYELLDKILMEIRNNSKITENFIAKKYLFSERTVRRYFKYLKDNKKIILINKGKDREWKIL